MMKEKMLLNLSFFASALLFFAGYLLTNSVEVGFCSQDEYSCRQILNTIGDTLYVGMGALAIVFLALIFAGKGAFQTWKKFAVWYIPFAALIFVFYNPNPGDWAAPLREDVLFWVAAIYVVLSAFNIWWSYRKNQKK